MVLKSGGLWIWIGVACLMAQAPARAATMDKFDPAEYQKPSECPLHYTFDKDNGTCGPNTIAIKALVEKDCKAAGFTFSATGCEPSAKVPNPECKPIPGYSSKISGTGKGATCTFERTIPVSASGDYIGDCFEIRVVPAGTMLEEGKEYFVSSQKNLDNEDRELTLVSGRVGVNWGFGCMATGGSQYQISASKLIEAGAIRRGYTYGFLTMPYKYFPSEKSFVVNAPIGGYMGWRSGQAGSGTTLALAVTLSTVKANTVDPKQIDPATGKPTVTGTTDVAALSGAFGVMFDILKSPRGKPFKAGVFFGRDIVSNDPTIDYRFNRKNWFAIQIGYDFTDN